MQAKLNLCDELRARLAKKSFSEATRRSLEEDFRLRFTYNSNAIEGNTLTLIETKVVLEGITIGGKTLKEHFEAVGHAEAVDMMRELARQSEFREFDVKSLHALVLKRTDDANAGRYRDVDVIISGASHKPPSFLQVDARMQELVRWRESEAVALHPVVRAARMHAKLVAIHPFVDGNGRTARLLLNLELLRGGFPCVVVEKEHRLDYYEALDAACGASGELEKFDFFVVELVVKRLYELLAV